MRQSPKAAASRHHGDGRPHGKPLRAINAEWGLNDFPDAVAGEDGVGGGVLDRLRELGLPVAGLKGGTAPIDKERSSTSEPSGSGARGKRFENGEVDIDPDDDVLAAQLWAIKWDLTSRGQIEIESMDEIRKRGLPSPDRADAPGPTPSPSWTCLQSTSSRTRARASPGI